MERLARPEHHQAVITRRLQRIKVQLADLNPQLIGGRPKNSLLAPKSFELNLQWGCNSHCRHCSIWRHKEKSMPLNDVFLAIDQIRSWVQGATPWVHLIGGEPTIRDDLPLIFAYLRERAMSFHITTNGMRFADEAFAKSLVDAGLGLTVISIEGQREVHDYLRGKGCFDKAIAGVRNLRRIAPHLPIVFMAVVTGQNLNGLAEFATWAHREFGVVVQFQALTFDFGDSPGASADEAGEENQSLQQRILPRLLKDPLWPTDLPLLDRTLDALHDLKEQEAQTGKTVIGNAPAQFAFWKRYFRNPFQFVTAKPCNIGDFHVDCDHRGDVRLCPHKAPVGNIHEHTLQEIFYSPTAAERRHEISHCRLMCNSLLNCRFHELAATKNL